jgi:hypothetical protein
MEVRTFVLFHSLSQLLDLKVKRMKTGAVLKGKQ